MIVGDGFVWAHLPKTGGDAAAAMFAAVPRLAVARDDPHDHRKHQTIEARVAEGLDLSGRVTVCTIRRLPAWVLSSARHQERHYALAPDWEELRRGVVRSRVPMGRWHRLLPGPVRAAAYRAVGRTEAVSADTVLARHTAVPVDRWLRQEHLADDVVALLRDVAGLSAEEEAAVRAVPAVNANAYDHDVAAVFDDADLATLRAANPAWSALEARLY